MIAALDKLLPLSTACKLYLKVEIKVSSFKKWNHIATAGEFCEAIYFIKKGVVRGYVDHDGRDITSWMKAENEFILCLPGAGGPLPFEENMEAVQNCEVMIITQDGFKKQSERFPEFNILMRLLLQHDYRKAEQRAFIARYGNAKAKYNYFLKHYPNLRARVRYKDVASLLGITLETLSRLKEKK